MVFYRKYRPQTIAELDSKEIRNKLYSVFSNLSSIPHAYLFTGPKGLGKTSAARIVAKVVNCEKKGWEVGNEKLEKEVGSGKKKKSNLSSQNPSSHFQHLTSDIEPCNKCYQCISITNGTNLDILEIDGASNRGIDEIRDLREKVRLLPVSSQKKIYIIDEVHMLTTEAFNALLKTLEEPPPHVIFILCTTEPQKVPETIVSRCSHISFKLATQEELLSSFTRITKEEKLDFEKEALSYIAEMSDGSFRDGVKILDELAAISSSSKTKISKELVETKYQVSSIKYQVLKLLEYLEKKDTKEALKLVSDLVEQGVDMKYFLEKLVSELHSILLKKVGVEFLLPGDLEVTPVMAARQRPRLLPGGTVEELKNLIELFTKAYGELKHAVLPQLPLEIAVIEWGMQAKENKADDTRRAEVSKSKSSSSLLNESRSPKDNLSSNDKTGSAFSSSASGQATPIWQEIISRVKSHNHSFAGILRGCSLKNFDGKDVVIETAYKFHKERLDDKKAREVLEKVIEEITGKSAKIVIVLKER